MGWCSSASWGKGGAEWLYFYSCARVQTGVGAGLILRCAQGGTALQGPANSGSGVRLYSYSEVAAPVRVCRNGKVRYSSLSVSWQLKCVCV